MVHILYIKHTSTFINLQALQGHREDSAHSLPPHVSRPKEDQASANLSNLIDDNGVISAQGLSEISQLLMMYRLGLTSSPSFARNTPNWLTDEF